MEQTELIKLIKYTIEETLSSIGFSIDDKQSIQEDLIFLRKKRRKYELFIKDLSKSVLAFLIPVIFYYLMNKFNI